ncbi:hypothetical protein HT102_08685 [Hoyosella sp. G463]|uniref:Uncharacterized protein n=1 Tax=Lolliginicoccus lacisalsi TaxID=2742202 RepID=A0A927JCC3_9ACTN|nr:hypothetical protein [Lolliginicoccus lacisalsi]MBD8506560.1 hypothetical protein [Lolliginicoccus lacisalsi]
MADELVVQQGIRVTNVARTIVDIARSEMFEQAVVVGDAALHRNAVTRAALAIALERARGRVGIPRAREVVRLLDGRSESVGESRSRVLMHMSGIQDVHPQGAILGPDGTIIARGDFVHDDGLVGEFDGMGKYAKHRLPGETPGDALAREKRREDAIRAAGWHVHRWTWADLHDPDRFIERFWSALEHARRHASPERQWRAT